MRRLLVLLLCAPLAYAEPLPRLTLVIHHLYDGRPLDFAASTLTTAAGEKISVTRLAYLLAEPALKPAGSDEWITNHDWFAFTDAAKGTATHVLSGLPQQSFDALRICIGPDAVTDGKDPGIYPPRHALNPTVNGLHWGWTGGFVFLAIEGNIAAKDGSLGYSYHLAGAANRMTVTLPTAIDLTQDTTIDVDFHVDRLFAGSPPLVLAEQTSTHSRPGDALATRLKTQVESAFAIRSIHRTEDASLPAAAGSTAPLVGTPYRFTFPRGFPMPELPTDFPLTEERVVLGRALFHDVRLSRNQSQSCATCHDPTFVFSDPRPFSIGIDGQRGTRHAMPLFNLAWKREFFWDGRAASLRQQALEPIENPIEMHESLPHVVEKLSADAATVDAFAKAYGTREITAERLGVALEAFMLTLVSFDSKFDRSLRGEATLTDAERRGFELFVTEYDPRREQFGADCFHCHGGALFTDHAFRNNGLDTSDPGRAAVTHLESDRGKFATPSLRDVALTAPYMHDARFATLEEVIAHYDHGVERTPALDPNLGKHPATGLNLSAADQAALVAFLKTLTGSSRP
ncbi:MAG: MbnP family protein [Chthoniobacteraceae bacterium]